MNRYPTSSAPNDYGDDSLTPPVSSPNSKQEEFGQDETMNGFGQDGSRFHQALSPTSTPCSARVDLKDPIQVHLLTETALLDSRGYEILSQEEVDELKKQADLLSQRAESTRSNLAIQCKYRDAAASMARLGQGAGADDDQFQESERERIQCEKRCDELASELLNLEKRLLIPHRKIVEHTAAILQLTHKASGKKTSPQSGQPVHGIPGSPESLYTYSQGRDSLDQMSDDAYFDDPSGYQLDGSERARQKANEIPPKSPIREQNLMRGELDRMREENTHLRNQTDGLLKKLQGLNVSLRDTIVRFNPEVNDVYDEPPRVSATQDMEPADLLRSQMEYLESGLVAVQAEQDYFARGGQIGGGQLEGSQIGERIENINLQLRDLLMISDPHFSPTVMPSESDVNGQMAYLEESIRSIEAKLDRTSNPSGTNEDAGPMLLRLWESMQRGLTEARKRKEDRRRTRAEKGLPEDDGGISDDETFDPDEPYSLESFSNRVQWLQAQAMTLRDQKYVLKRQIKQQRELNNKSDAEKDEELARKQEDLEQSRQLLSRAEKDAMDAQRLLSETMADLEEARNAAAGAADTVRASIEQRDTKIADLEKNLKAAQESLASAEKDLSTARSGPGDTEESMAEMAAQLEAVTQEKKAVEETTKKLQTEVAEITARVAALTQEKEAADQTTEELERELTDKTAQVAVLRQAKEEAERTSERLQRELAEVTAQVTTSTQAQQVAEKTSERLQRELTGITEDMASLQQERTVMDEATRALKTELAAKTKQFKIKDDEVDQLNMTIAELKTEVTIARAELDGAYGSRAERAAEVAAIKQNSECLKLQNQVDRLKKELGATVEELEGVTKETIGFEKEKADIEAKLDEALAARTCLETEVQKARDKMAKLQEELDGERLKIPSEASRPGAGASMLSERFRATMREERKKFQEDLREERIRCRKLEEELARLKRSQGPGKSPLSPR